MSGTTNKLPNAGQPDLNQITQLLKQIIETQMAHTSMLKRVVDAATKPIEAVSPVALALQALVASTDKQTGTLQAAIQAMEDLPDKISAVMRTEIDLAMTES